jgi:hypothetical protein
MVRTGGKIVVRIICEKLKLLWMSGLDTTVVVAAGVLLLLGGSSLAQQLTKRSFSSPDEACQALFAAVKSGNNTAVAGVLGGSEELVSSGDLVEDRQDREQFVEKYQQMHRLVEQPDGTTVLYIGAENWPFPVPLISRNGKWYFDTDSGAQEIGFRRVGENEAATIELCRELAIGSQHPGLVHDNGDGALEYARQMIKADAVQTNERVPPAALHGYYFRKLQGGNDAGESPIAVAYPAVYRSSGVMTFVVTRNGDVYKKDLGPRTKTQVIAMTMWKPDRTWSIAD